MIGCRMMSMLMMLEANMRRKGVMRVMISGQRMRAHRRPQSRDDRLPLSSSSSRMRRKICPESEGILALER